MAGLATVGWPQWRCERANRFSYPDHAHVCQVRPSGCDRGAAARGWSRRWGRPRRSRWLSPLLPTATSGLGTWLAGRRLMSMSATTLRRPSITAATPQQSAGVRAEIAPLPPGGHAILRVHSKIPLVAPYIGVAPHTAWRSCPNGPCASPPESNRRPHP